MFSDRLNLLMIQLNASGAQIAKYAGFDRTNVSRLRSGARIPVSGGPTAEKLISGIYLFADSNNSLPVLCEITGQPLSASAEEKMAGLSDWLFGGEEKQSPRPERPKKAAASSVGLLQPTCVSSRPGSVISGRMSTPRS